jgi:choline dehydrogenase-like flavoprotein
MAGMNNNPDVAVIGAGFAGLSAAARLARDGARVVVVEAKSRLGGRATAFEDRETGELVDNGQHILLGCYHETFAFLQTIGADGNVQLQPQLAITMIDRAGQAGCRARRCRRRFILRPASSTGTPSRGAIDWRLSAWPARCGLRGRNCAAGRRMRRRETKPSRTFSSGPDRRNAFARCCGNRWRWRR